MTAPLKSLALACLVAAPLALFAAEPALTAPPAEPPTDALSGAMPGKRCPDGRPCNMPPGERCDHEKMEHGKMDHGKMGHGMHPPGGMIMVPPLPPGNEKLQLQMEAEIHQKVGEILNRYAGQLK